MRFEHLHCVARRGQGIERKRQSQLRGLIVQQHPVAQLRSLGPLPTLQVLQQHLPALQSSTERRVQRSKAGLPREQKRGLDQREGRAAIGGGEGSGQGVDGRANHRVLGHRQWLKSQNGRSPCIACARLQHDARTVRRREFRDPRAEEELKQGIGVAASIDDGRRSEQQHVATLTEFRETSVAMRAAAAHVMRFIDDDECSGQRFAVAAERLH